MPPPETKKATNILAIALKLKIRVYMASGWPDNICGSIIEDAEKGGESGFAILVNKTHSKRRRRFTIAHELAHYFLHKDEIGNGITDDSLYRSRLSASKERMANEWALDILMPYDLINAAIREGSETVEALADAFNVSVSAMAVRLGIPSG